MFVSWARDCYYRTRGIVRDVCSLVLGRTTQFLEQGSRNPHFLRAETWGACRARVQHSECRTLLCCSGVVAQSPCDGYLLHVVLPLHRFPACSPDRSRTGSTAQWDF